MAEHQIRRLLHELRNGCTNGVCTRSTDKQGALPRLGLRPIHPQDIFGLKMQGAGTARFLSGNIPGESPGTGGGGSAPCC